MNGCGMLCEAIKSDPLEHTRFCSVLSSTLCLQQTQVTWPPSSGKLLLQQMSQLALKKMGGGHPGNNTHFSLQLGVLLTGSSVQFHLIQRRNDLLAFVPFHVTQCQPPRRCPLYTPALHIYSHLHHTKRVTLTKQIREFLA